MSGILKCSALLLMFCCLALHTMGIISQKIDISLTFSGWAHVQFVKSVMYYKENEHDYCCMYNSTNITSQMLSCCIHFAGLMQQNPMRR